MPPRAADPTPRRVPRLPGVYRPQPDSQLIATALREAAVPVGAHVLDLCTGPGLLAVTAARLGAARVEAVDVARPAVWSARMNGRMRGLPVRGHRGDLYEAFALGPFDVVLANPPYVPCEPGAGCSPRWDAGPDGRDVIDPLCDNAAELLNPGGFLLMIQSELAGEEASLHRLRAAGLKAAIVARRRIPFVPVIQRRISLLRARGLIGADCHTEELVVIRADRPSRRYAGVSG